VKVAGLLLAAGRSTRFGAADKLAALLDGRPLLDHAAAAMRELDLAARFVVRPAGAVPCPGFVGLAVERSQAGLGHSLAVGTRAARLAGADAVLVALGDMPFVTSAHLAAVVAAGWGTDVLVASTDGAAPTPPALIGADWFPQLEALDADEGARPLLRQARLVRAPAGTLRDIDTPADLARQQDAGPKDNSSS